MNREPSLIRDLFDTLPPWGEFDLRPSWQHDTFVLDVGYEVAGTEKIETISLRFPHAQVMLKSGYPPPPAFVASPIRDVEIDRGQLVDLGNTELLAEVLDQGPYLGLTAPLHHYYLYFTDMWQAFQVVSTNVEIA